MEINIISVGRLKERYLQEGIDDFIKRLRPYSRINMIELADERIPANPSLKEQEAIKNKEGERILSSLGERTYVIALDIKGKPMSSEGLARSIQDLQVQGYSSISFIIGGALGLSTDLLKRADFRLSISQMTFTHQMVRLILLEQVYRAFRIIRGEPYHL